MTRIPANMAACDTMFGPSEFVATGIHRDYDITGRLPEISVPTLFTCGRHDMTRPEETAQDHARVPGSEMAVFAESSHMPHLEEPEHYLNVVRGFMRRIDDAHPSQR
jgi:proline iminopeptidase